MADKNWNEISDDELLNDAGAGDKFGQLMRYDRIMLNKTVVALDNLWGGLFDLKKALHAVTDKIDARLASAEQTQKEAAASANKLQGIVVALTIVIAVCTIAYTWITWESVQAQREANQIQRESMAKFHANENAARK